MTLVRSFDKAKRQIASKQWKHVDVVLLGAVAALSILGCVMIYSSSRSRLAAQGLSTTYFAERQVGFVIVGVLLMIGVMSVDYRKLRDLSPIIYLGVLALLVLVLSPIGSAVNGTQGWFSLPGGFQLQPSEFSKFFLIIVLASYISQHEQFHLPALVQTLIIAVIPIGLVLLQPDLGTAMVLSVIVLGMLSVAGTRGRYLLVLGLIAIIGVVGILQLGVLKNIKLIA